MTMNKDKHKKMRMRRLK